MLKDLQVEHRFAAMLRESASYQVEWRKRNELNTAYYDGTQWTDEEAAVIEARGQQASVLNVCRQVIDSLLGVYYGRRSDVHIVGREPGDDETAAVATELFKQVVDRTEYQYTEGQVFRDGAVSGMGWFGLDVEGEGKDARITIRQVPWEDMFWDPFSRHPTAEDARYIMLRSWMDRDEVADLWPQKSKALSDWIDTTYVDDFAGQEAEAQLYGNSAQVVRYYDLTTRRVAVYETWYRTARKELRRVVWAGPEFLEGGERDADNAPPFDSGVLPYIPFFASRDKDGRPQGVLDWIRDEQDSLNKLWSKWQWNMACRQAIADANAVPDPEALRTEIARPDGVIITNPGMLQSGAVQILKNTEESAHLASMITFLVQMIQRTSGINDATIGIGGVNARSAEQEKSRLVQGAAMQSTLIENIFRTKRAVSRAVMKLIGEFYTAPQYLRVLGPDGAASWYQLNSEFMAEDGTLKTYALKDLLEYDLVLTHVAEFDTSRQLALKILEKIATVLPPELVGRGYLENSSIPDKTRYVDLLNRIKQEEAQRQQQQLALKQQAVTGRASPG